MITANPTSQQAVETPTAHTQASATAPSLVPYAPCPCGFPIRRIYAGELICANCGKRETVAAEFWQRIQAACVRGLSGVRI